MGPLMFFGARLMVKSDLMKFGLVSGAIMSMLGGLAIVWNIGHAGVTIDPLVEKACYDEVKHRAPLGHRAIMTYDYREEGSKLGIASGGLEAQYAPNKWTQVAWTCRINPTNREIARIELVATTGGQRMKAAASSFQ